MAHGLAGGAHAAAALPIPQTTLQKMLLAGVHVCLAAVLAMPLVVLVDAAHGFVVGKALLAYTAIEIALVLWTLLVLANPAFLPPRSTVLALLALGLAWSVVAAALGVSWQRSLWSTYPRMHGLVGGGHWFVFVALVAAVFRPLPRLAALIAVNLGVSVVVAAFAVASAYELPVPLYGTLPERDFPRVGGTVGNAIPLGVYAVVNVVLALTLLASTRQRAAKDARDGISSGTHSRWTMYALCAVAVVGNCCAFTVAGSLTATMAALGGLVVFAAAVAIRGRGRWRYAAFGVLGFAASTGLTLVLLFLFVEPAPKGTYQQPLVKRIAEMGAGSGAAFDRLSNMQVAWASFAQAPLSGFGPENFLAVYGRFMGTEDPPKQPQADAHNALFEKLATEGLPGFLCLLALWLAAGFALFRAAARAPPGERGLLLGLATALACYLIASQTANWNITSNLLWLLLLAAAAQVERADAAGPGRVAQLLQPHAVRLGLVLIALVLAATGLATSQNLHRAAIEFATGSRATPNPYDYVPPAVRAERTLLAMAHYRRAIDAFPPLANRPRRFLFDDLDINWPALRVRHGAEAKRWLAYAEAQGTVALAAEPANWLLHHSLARLYVRAATTDPNYQALAVQHLESSAEVAPNMAVYSPPLK